MARSGPLDSTERQLVTDLYPSLRRFASVVSPPEDDPNDLVQEALVRTLRRGPLGRLDDPGAYLRRAIYNLAAGSRRSLARRRTALSRLGVPAAAPEEHSWDVQELLALPPRARAVLFLRVIEGRPFAEIAELVGGSQVAVRATASRARRRLRDMIEEDRRGTA